MKINLNGKAKEHIIYAVKGFAVGAVMTVPGMSGGTLAIVLDIYDKLVFAVAGIFKNFKKNIIFLMTVGVAGISGMFAFSKLILLLSDFAPVPTRFFFIGAILGGVPLLLRKAKMTKPDLKTIIFILFGVIIVFLLELIPQGLFDLSGSFSFSMLPALLVSGGALSLALIAPGISFSHMLLIFGLHESFFSALSNVDFGYIALILIPTGLATLLFIKLMEFVMKKYPTQTYCVVLGFVVGSIKDLYIGFPAGWQIPVTVLTFTVGLAAVLAISRKET